MTGAFTVSQKWTEQPKGGHGKLLNALSIQKAICENWESKFAGFAASVEHQKEYREKSRATLATLLTDITEAHASSLRKQEAVHKEMLKATISSSGRSKAFYTHLQGLLDSLDSDAAEPSENAA